MQNLPVKRALISVTHKNGLVELAGFLAENGVEIVSTGGTARLLKDNGVPVTGISQVTGFPEILGGRVKTLHPFVHAGILADKDNEEHINTLKGKNIKPFDLICVNLYDFASAVQDNMGIADAVEKIDIGGPTLLRAAAKNFHSVCVLPHPDFYQPFMDQLKSQGFIDLAFRHKTAGHVFEMTSKYDRMIADYLLGKSSS